MANLVGKKASTVEALLLDKNDMKQEPIIGAGGVSKDIILITSGATEKAPDEDISFPHVVGKNIIDAINEAGTVANATNATNASKIQVNIEGNNPNPYYPIYVSNTVLSASELAGKIVFITEE